MYVMCRHMHSIRRMYISICIHLHPHTHTHVHKSPKRMQMFIFYDVNAKIDLKAFSCFKIAFNTVMISLLVIRNFYTYTECYGNHKLINYAVILNLKQVK